MLCAGILLAACGNDSENAEELTASYYTLIKNKEFEEMADYLSGSLLDHLEMSAVEVVADL